MLKRVCTAIFFLLFSLTTAAAEKGQPLKLYDSPPLPATVDKQLRQAQVEFDQASHMFNPWYAGPLLTPSAHNVPKGMFVVQPYLFIQDTYAVFTENRRSQNIPDIWTVQPLILYQMGWLTWLDFTLTLQGFYQSQSGKDSFYWGDTSFEWGIQLMKEDPYRPAVRFTVTETVPTGRYEKLNPAKNGIDATGAGAYSTNLSLNVSKVIWWISTHPFAFRASFNYEFPNALPHVQGFNAYGGGRGTSGRIRPGNTIAIDTSIELSFTQKWVLAIDLAYTYQNASTFSGHKGRTKSGEIAYVGAPSNDSFSAAPAIEYNPSENMGFLAGVWFTITGRNSPDFVSGVLTYYYSW